MSEEISLAEFVKKAKKDLENFEAYWLQKQKESPKWYPSKLSPGDWDEQLITFLGHIVDHNL